MICLSVKPLFLGFKVLDSQFKLVSYIGGSSRCLMRIIRLDLLSNSYFVGC
jgi:hypothetical protein